MFKHNHRVRDLLRTSFGDGTVISIMKETPKDPYVVGVRFDNHKAGLQWYTATGAFYRNSKPTLVHINPPARGGNV